MSSFKDYFNLTFFVESPEYYNADFNKDMQDVEYNKSRAEYLIAKSQKLQPYKGYEVYRCVNPFNDEDISYYFIKDGIIQGATEIVTRKDNNFCVGVWQRNVPENKGLLRTVYINHIPQIYKSLILDKTANRLGKEFIKKLLTDYIGKGYKVVVLEGSLTNETPYEPEQFESYWTAVNIEPKSHPTYVAPKDRLFKIYF